MRKGLKERLHSSNHEKTLVSERVQVQTLSLGLRLMSRHILTHWMQLKGCPGPLRCVSPATLPPPQHISSPYLKVRAA